MIDLLVVGAGPAGLATALFAAREGLRAVVVDGRSGPIDKACGEGLMPGALRALTELGVDPGGRELRGIRYLDGRRRIDAPFASGFGRGVRRTTLHAGLTLAAEQAGVDFVAGRVGQVSQNYAGVTMNGITARYLAAADGLHSTIAAQLGLAGPPAKGPRRWGLRQHFAVPPWTDLVEVHWAASCEAYVTPVGPDTVGVAVLSGTRRPFADQLADFPDLLAQLGGAPPVSRVLGAGPLKHRTNRRTAGRVLLVGDASGYVDALTGEGIAVALSCARALVQAVVAGRPKDYEALWRKESRRYRLITSGLLAATSRPVIRRSLVPAARALPGVFAALVNQLAQ